MDVSQNDRDRSTSTESEQIQAQNQELKKLIFKQLKKQVGNVPSNLETQVMNLSAEALENLGKDLLDFNTLDNLIVWFKKNQD